MNPTCKHCGETLEGDGYTTVLRCPMIRPDDDDVFGCGVPDEGPFYCTEEDEL